MDQVIQIHDAETTAPLLDYNALASAVHSPMAGFGDFEPYPTLFEKAAVLLAHLANNHAFHDGNKRCAWISCRVFLLMNGISIEPTTEEIVQFVEECVVRDKWGNRDIAVWLNEHQA
ncbi:type II toxin-antitoxin system death-on-curing family toxin [Brevibacterium spongiae]|uniref:Type II toxin-antitoxin system death-on-curing family toxin n=1 Tax=Brevibacterium spongiae TaxID=2909672 RepID=A0ABY5SQ81_9MICO|nr:type II toxin-antitoxin system death-on-curing family toxin [Brevibacterium spongiae]UVI36652.1 type II toxin-antitoxin system death-on-curing family toxin [Brevibacterium spongiae]